MGGFRTFGDQNLLERLPASLGRGYLPQTSHGYQIDRWQRTSRL